MARTKFDEAVKNYTKKELEQHRQDALDYYLSTNGEASVKVLSRVAKVPQAYIRKWMKEGKWSDMVNPSITPGVAKAMNTLAEELGLTEQEETFCLEYLKTYNGTNAAIRAGYPPPIAYNSSCKLLKKEHIKKYLQHIRDLRNQELYIDALDIIREYQKIAFADITDFVSFGPSGMQFKHSQQVDGSIISEVKEGKAGNSIKLHDKMRALKELSKYLDVFPEDVLKRDLLKAQVDLIRGTGDEEGPLEIRILRGSNKGENK